MYIMSIPISNYFPHWIFSIFIDTVIAAAVTARRSTTYLQPVINWFPSETYFNIRILYTFICSHKLCIGISYIVLHTIWQNHCCYSLNYLFTQAAIYHYSTIYISWPTAEFREFIRIIFIYVFKTASMHSCFTS